MDSSRLRELMSRNRRKRDRVPTATTEYTDKEGNVLTLRDSVSAGTVAKLKEPMGVAASSREDLWARRMEMLFERFAVSWTIAGLPLKGQRELLGRYRLADRETQQWVRSTVEEHVRHHHPELDQP